MSATIQLSKIDERDLHSQFGEDGIIARIFDSLGVDRGTAVEFGAWDGVYLSNTAALRARGWTTVLIEGDPAKVRELQVLASADTLIIGAMVTPEGDSSLDSLLDARKIGPIDFLSIDIDGDDIHIFASLRRRPRVVCIEFNPTVPPPYSLVNPRGTCRGSSLAALCSVAEELGYELVYASYCNAFFVVKADAVAFVTADVFRAYYSVPRPAIVALFDGAFEIRNGAFGLYRHAWSTLPVYVPSLPRSLLGWPSSHSKVLLAYLYSAFAAPFFYLRELTRELGRQARKRSPKP